VQSPIQCGAITEVVPQLAVDAFYYGLPTGVLSGLPEEAHRWIPGGVFAIQHPAPVRIPGEQGPDRYGKRAGEVRGHGVDGNQEVDFAQILCGVEDVGRAFGDIGYDAVVFRAL
jgi:hypothetical protein